MRTREMNLIEGRRLVGRTGRPLLKQLFFIQIKVNEFWVFLYPTHPTYGFQDIESCNEAIDELEKQDEEWDLMYEYRLKEELA